MTASTDLPQTSVAEPRPKPAQPILVVAAVALSLSALVASGVSLAGWAQASEERQQIETRLQCLELPGPNDCGQDGE